VRHLDVEEHELRLVVLDRGHRLLAVARLRDDLDVGLGAEQRNQAFTRERLIVDDERLDLLQRSRPLRARRRGLTGPDKVIGFHGSPSVSMRVSLLGRFPPHRSDQCWRAMAPRRRPPLKAPAIWSRASVPDRSAASSARVPSSVRHGMATTTLSPAG
jgi:hypothetical protein